MWIDIHAHLDRLPPDDLSATIGEASAAGVTVIVSTATDCASAAKVILQCQTFPSLYGALGVSPFDAGSLPQNWESRLCLMLDNERTIAVGEIGLDHSNPKYPAMELQLPVFEKQLDIAAQCGKPVIVHSRGAEKKVAGICRSSGITRVLFHCFTADRDALKFILECGYYVSFSGVITYNTAVKELVKDVPLDRLFIETDSPYCAPVPHRGKNNRPAWAALVGESVAVIKGIPAGELQAAIHDNFKRLFYPHLPD